MDAEEVAALEFVLHAVAKSMMVVLNALKYSARENVRSQRGKRAAQRKIAVDPREADVLVVVIQLLEAAHALHVDFPPLLPGVGTIEPFAFMQDLLKARFFQQDDAADIHTLARGYFEQVDAIEAALDTASASASTAASRTRDLSVSSALADDPSLRLRAIFIRAATTMRMYVDKLYGYHNRHCASLTDDVYRKLLRGDRLAIRRLKAIHDAGLNPSRLGGVVHKLAHTYEKHAVRLARIVDDNARLPSISPADAAVEATKAWYAAFSLIPSKIDLSECGNMSWRKGSVVERKGKLVRYFVKVAEPVLDQLEDDVAAMVVACKMEVVRIGGIQGCSRGI